VSELVLDDKALGYIVLIGSLLGIGFYFYLVFMSPQARMVVQVSAFLAVAAVLLILAWIGYTLITTPPPLPLEDFVEEASTDE